MLSFLIQQVQALIPNKKVDLFGKDSLMFSTLPYYFLPMIMVIWVTGIISNPFVIIFLLYTTIPLLDEIFSLDERNPNQQQRKQLINMDFIFRMALYASMIMDWYLFFFSMDVFSKHEWSLNSTIRLIGYVFLFSNLNSTQFLIAHQICHKPGKFNRWLATIHLSKLLYMHWIYEHLYGHHRRVGTPEDPASAIQGDSVYRFFPKTLVNSFTSVYQMEKKAGKSFITNYAVLGILGAFAFTGVVYYFYGLQATAIFLVSQFGAIFYLQAINYIEHYGLQRQKLPNGQYEKVTIRHSWNAPHRFSNYLLYKLQRHSDHHQNSTKPYQTLLSLEESPHLPNGYSLMIFMSFFPQVWFRVMDPIVNEYKVVKNGRIQSEVMVKGTQETKKFAIQLGMATMLLCALTIIA